MLTLKLNHVGKRAPAVWYVIPGRKRLILDDAWWRHQMESLSTLLAICAGNSPVTVKFPAQTPGTRSFDVFFDLRLINGWVNNGEAGDVRRHCAHYDVIVMERGLSEMRPHLTDIMNKWIQISTLKKDAVLRV